VLTPRGAASSTSSGTTRRQHEPVATDEAVVGRTARTAPGDFRLPPGLALPRQAAPHPVTPRPVRTCTARRSGQRPGHRRQQKVSTHYVHLFARLTGRIGSVGS